MFSLLGKAVLFVGMFIFIFVLTFAVLSDLGLAPEIPTNTVVQVEREKSLPTKPQRAETPVRIVARDIGLDAPIVNPDSKEIKVLDKALLSGAVRYPGTAMLGTEGTSLLFGHSSYLPLLQNNAYKTFNDIQKLEQGAIISVYSDELEYRYEVIRVEQANATADRITLENDGRYIKLVTCNSFGSKEDRFVVTAVFVAAYSS